MKINLFFRFLFRYFFLPHSSVCLRVALACGCCWICQRLKLLRGRTFNFDVEIFQLSPGTSTQLSAKSYLSFRCRVSEVSFVQISQISRIFTALVFVVVCWRRGGKNWKIAKNTQTRCDEKAENSIAKIAQFNFNTIREVQKLENFRQKFSVPRIMSSCMFNSNKQWRQVTSYACDVCCLIWLLLNFLLAMQCLCTAEFETEAKYEEQKTSFTSAPLEERKARNGTKVKLIFSCSQVARWLRGRERRTKGN